MSDGNMKKLSKHQQKMVEAVKNSEDLHGIPGIKVVHIGRLGRFYTGVGMKRVTWFAIRHLFETIPGSYCDGTIHVRKK